MNKRLPAAIGFFVLLSVAAQACAPGPVVIEQPRAGPEVVKPEVRAGSAWEQDWEQTLSAARKEGVVTFYTNYAANWRQAFSEALARKYSIRMETVIARTQENTARVIQEKRAGLGIADVMAISQSYVGPLRREGILRPLEEILALPEVVDPKAWWLGGVTWVEPEEKNVLAFRGSVSAPLVINTEMVKAGEVKSWNDLLDPKWKGKIVLNDPTLSGAGQVILMVLAHSMKDWDYVRALFRQEPQLQRDNRLMVEWVARGRYPILVGPRKEEAFQFMQLGAPVNYLVPSEGAHVDVGDGSLGMMKNSPHPNAAKVLVNFFLSREGQTIFQTNLGNQTMRVDVSDEGLAPGTARQPGVKYFVPDLDEGFTTKRPDMAAELGRMVEAYLRK
ncbi:MAG: extracellular solute-binding protein [Chloroflexi bacterium]|nr:extracellular solute-binding protein [Chloroflexota bacterium]